MLLVAKLLRPLRYRNCGSLVFWGFQSVGQLTSGLSGGRLEMKGWIV